jgi:hypothetical protein
VAKNGTLGDYDIGGFTSAGRKASPLAELRGTTVDKVLLKALLLYDIASQAKTDNQRIGIVDAKQQLLAEVTGI